MRKSRWRHIAYLARYAHQQIDPRGLLAMSRADLEILEECISEIVEEESKSAS